MIFERLLPLLDRLATNKEPVDVLGLNYANAMDSIMAYIFGLGNGTNFIEDTKARQHWLHVYRSRRPFAFWDAELPTGVLSWVRVVQVTSEERRDVRSSLGNDEVIYIEELGDSC